jgi:hypothetical protein
MHNLLTEQVLFEYQVVKEANKPKKLRGLFQKSNAKNANGRVYSSEILTREIQRLQEAIKNRTLVGQLDHPQTATIEYAKASHLITAAQMQGEDCIGEIELLNTPCGKIVESLIDADVKVGISSRGLGTVRNEQEYLLVNDDYQLVTFDMVAEPSTPNAYPVPINESILQKLYRKDIRKPEHLKKAIHNIIDEYLKGQKGGK